MKKDILINKSDLLEWIDRPPSNDDLDLADFISLRLAKFYEFEKEIERLKSSYKLMEEALEDKSQEIDRLNNIINKLEEELDRGYRDLFEHELVPGRELIINIKNYLQELKGEDKE